MVLGLIDFLLGGKKKTTVPKNAQVTTPMNNTSQSGASLPNGQNNPTQNADGSLVFQDLNDQGQTQNNSNHPNSQVAGSSGPKKSISEVINKIHQELKETNDNIANITTDIKEIKSNVSSLDHRVSDLEGKNKTVEEKLTDIDDNMSKFLSLYELVNSQYNPFIDSVLPATKKEILLDDKGNSMQDSSNENLNENSNRINIQNLDVSKLTQDNKKSDLKSSLLELDTLNIEEAAGDAIPLTHLKSNTNSLVIILSWLEYMVKRVGIEETKDTLRYYTETLKWITPEVFFELDKFLRGMDNIEGAKLASCFNVRDHIVSLYFISKLNEKNLDQKLTSAVLEIIKED